MVNDEVVQQLTTGRRLSDDEYDELMAKLPLDDRVPTVSAALDILRARQHQLTTEAYWRRERDVTKSCLESLVAPHGGWDGAETSGEEWLIRFTGMLVDRLVELEALIDD